MTLNLSLSEILVNLETRIESLGEQMALHARQEEHHREQRALLEAELEKAKEHLESFRAVAATAADLDLPTAAPPPPPAEEDLGPHPTVAQMVARVVADRPEGERFGPKLVVSEVNRRPFPWRSESRGIKSGNAAEPLSSLCRRHHRKRGVTSRTAHGTLARVAGRRGARATRRLTRGEAMRQQLMIVVVGAALLCTAEKVAAQGYCHDRCNGPYPPGCVTLECRASYDPYCDDPCLMCSGSTTEYPTEDHGACDDPILSTYGDMDCSCRSRSSSLEPDGHLRLIFAKPGGLCRT